MRKFVIAGLASLLTLVSIVGLAQAKPGPNDSNNHGLCTAYFNGQKKGWSNHSTPGPFANLQSSAEAAEGSSNPDASSESANEIAEDVYNYCDQGALIGGNPDQNGRFASCYSTDTNSSVTFDCPSQ